MLNKVQQKIISLNSTDFDITTKDAIELFFTSLEQELNTKLSRDVNSPLYIVIKTLAVNVNTVKYQSLDLLSNLSDFFDNEKFDGYNSASYSGVYNALLSLAFIADANVYTEKAGTASIVVRLKEGYKLEDVKQDIANQIHKYLSIGILTSTPSSVTNIAVTVNAKTGQSITYNFCETKIRYFNLTITYKVDFEDTILSFDFEKLIKDAVTNTYNNNYGSIGKDFKIQDFYAIARDIQGLDSISVTIEELESKDSETVINTFTDTNIDIEYFEVFEFNAITVKLGA